MWLRTSANPSAGDFPRTRGLLRKTRVDRRESVSPRLPECDFLCRLPRSESMTRAEQTEPVPSLVASRRVQEFGFFLSPAPSPSWSRGRGGPWNAPTERGFAEHRGRQLGSAARDESENDSVAVLAGARGSRSGTPLPRRRGRRAGRPVGTGRRPREEMCGAWTGGDRSAPRATRRQRPSGRTRRHGECSGLTGARRRPVRPRGGPRRVLREHGAAPHAPVLFRGKSGFAKRTRGRLTPARGRGSGP
jgi:hypothetical protein